MPANTLTPAERALYNKVQYKLRGKERNTAYKRKARQKAKQVRAATGETSANSK